jgi:predicted amidophosphoribosyltransferase
VVAEPVCGACAATIRLAPSVAAPAGIDAWFAPFAYDGVARELIARVKYRRAHGVVGWLARAMAAGVEVSGDAVVTWAPTTPERRRERGFDHAELLARRLGRDLRLPARSFLRRLPGPPQTGLGAVERRTGPAFVPLRTVPPSIVLVDDVTTTGATLRAAGSALRAGGAQLLVAVTAARTPGPSTP